METFFVQLTKEYDQEPNELYPDLDPIQMYGVVPVTATSAEDARSLIEKRLNRENNETLLQTCDPSILWDDEIPAGTLIDFSFQLTDTIFEETSDEISGYTHNHHSQLGLS